jgi:hypothetical protein
MNDETSKKLNEEFSKRWNEIRQRLEYASDAELEAAKARRDLEAGVANEILKARRRQIARFARTIALAAWVTILLAVLPDTQRA